MNIRLHIERVVLEGLDLSQAEAQNLHASLEAELTRLLAGGLAPQLLSGGAYPSLAVPGLESGEHPPPKASTLGSQVAQAVYGGIGRSE